MCYDIESSLTAWVLANFISLYLFYRNKNYDRWNSAFITCFTTIQLLEAGIWWTESEGDKNMSNQLLTKMILLILLSQPLVQSYMGAKYTGSDILYFLSVIYFAILLWGLFRVGKAKDGQFYTSKNKNGHLIWHDSEAESKGGSFIGGGNGIINKVVPILYLGGLFVPLLFAKNYRGMPLLLLGVSTAIYSMTIANREGAFGSLWCFYSVLYAVVALFV